jgi:hypothetical protein
MRVDRRKFLTTTAAAFGGLCVHPTPVAAANPMVLFLGGLIVGEVVLGVLRAYGIDIGRTTEDVVRCFRGCRYPKQIACACEEQMISPRGRSQSGCLQVARRGYAAAKHPHADRPRGEWIPGSIMFATTQQLAKPGVHDLTSIGSGYAVRPHELNRPDDRDYFTVKQRFEAGMTTVVVRNGAEFVRTPSERDFSEFVLDMNWSSATV